MCDDGSQQKTFNHFEIYEDWINVPFTLGW